jgi:hypothetical protein
MPTIDQLPLAGPISPSDEVPLSQAGEARSASVALLLAGLQPLITMSPGALLGRSSTGDGSAELILPSVGLQLSSGALEATGVDHTSFALLSDLSQVQEVIVNAGGQPCRVPVAVLRSLFSAGSNVEIAPSGEISVSSFIPGSGPPSAGSGANGDTYLDTSTGALWVCTGTTWTPTDGSILETVSSLLAAGSTAAAVQLLPASGGTVGVRMPDEQCLIRITGAAAAQDKTSGDSILWDVAAAAKRLGSGLGVQLVGSASVSVFASDPSMAACTLAVSATQAGCTVTGVGLAGRMINWSATLMVTTCA